MSVGFTIGGDRVQHMANTTNSGIDESLIKGRPVEALRCTAGEWTKGDRDNRNEMMRLFPLRIIFGKGNIQSIFFNSVNAMSYTSNRMKL